MTKKRRTAKERVIGHAWVSIGTDGRPIGVAWYREHLQDNVQRVRVKLVGRLKGTTR